MKCIKCGSEIGTSTTGICEVCKRGWTLQSHPLQESTISKKETVQESEQMYPESFVIWCFENISMTCDYGVADSNPFYVGCDEMEFKTLPELLTYWKDNVQGKLMVDKFKMK